MRITMNPSKTHAARPVLWLTVLLVGLSTTSSADEGVAYFLPRTLVQVKATKKSVTGLRPDPSLGKRVPADKVELAYQINIASTADTTTAYALSPRPDFWKSKDMEVRLTSAGLLAGLNTESKGEGGAILSGFIRGLASIAGLLVFDEGGAPEKWPPAVRECESLKLEAVALDMQALVKRTARGCSLWRALEANSADQQEWTQRLANATTRLEQAPGPDFSRALETVREYRKQVGELTAARELLERELQASLKEFRKQYGLAEEEKTETREFHFDLADIPNEAEVPALITVAAGPETPKKFVSMVALIRWAGLAVSGDTLGTVPKDGGTGAVVQAKEDDLVVTYRRSRPVRLIAWKKDPAKGDWNHDQVTVAQAFISGDPLLKLRLPLSAFSQRRLEADFDASGQPQRVKTTSSASGTAVAAAVASAATEATGAYKASLDQLLGTKKAKNALEAEDLTSRLSELKQRKEIVDARVSLAGAAGSAADRTRKQELDAQIELLQAELRQQQGEATFDLRLEIEVLKAQVESLVQQLAKLKAEQDLKKKS